MKTKLVLCVLLLVCVVSLSATPQTKAPQWEYKFDYKCTEKRANEYAAQGWELATHSSSPMSGGDMALEICIFKRAK